MASIVFTIYSIIFVVPLTMRGCAALLSRWVAHACCGVVVVGSDREEESLDYVSTVIHSVRRWRAKDRQLVVRADRM